MVLLVFEWIAGTKLAFAAAAGGCVYTCAGVPIVVEFGRSISTGLGVLAPGVRCRPPRVALIVAMMVVELPWPSEITMEDLLLLLAAGNLLSA